MYALMLNLKSSKHKWLAMFLLTLLVIVALITLSGCTSDEYNDRKEKQNSTTLKNSLGIQAQKERLSREDDTSAIRYVYLMNYGQIVGYYVIKGGVYGADTQLAPEQEIICRYNGDSCQGVDSAKDDGTYGGADAGVFFITSDDVLIETTLDYIQSDQPIAIDVPRLGGSK